jgi:hypothetical protein
MVTGTLTAPEQTSARFVPAAHLRRGRFNVSIWGDFDGTVQFQRTFDGGATWLACSKPDLSRADFSETVSFVVEETEDNVDYRLICTAYTSGTINYRMSR